MNKYEKRAEQQRRSGVRSSMMMGTAGIAFLAVVLLILGLNNSMPRAYFVDTAIALAILLLILRQAGRRMKSRVPRSARPDPRSRLKLDD